MSSSPDAGKERKPSLADLATQGTPAGTCCDLLLRNLCEGSPWLPHLEHHMGAATACQQADLQADMSASLGASQAPKHVRGQVDLEALLLPRQHRGSQLVHPQLRSGPWVCPAQQCSNFRKTHGRWFTHSSGVAPGADLHSRDQFAEVGMRWMRAIDLSAGSGVDPWAALHSSAQSEEDA